jgi:hypothetical protein
VRFEGVFQFVRLLWVWYRESQTGLRRRTVWVETMIRRGPLLSASLPQMSVRVPLGSMTTTGGKEKTLKLLSRLGVLP